MHDETTFDDADLNGFVDGRMEPSRASALAHSLASDPEAASRMAAWRRQNDSLRAMFASVLSDPLPVRLLPTAVPARGPVADRPVTPPAPGRRLAGVVATLSLGTALIGFALGALASVGTDGFGLVPTPVGPFEAQPSTFPEGRDLAERAVEAHRTFLTDPSRPVEMTAGEEPKLARWIARRVGAALRVPSLSRQGWTFLGGRIVPGRRGPAAFLAYGSGADRLSLTVSRGSVPDQGRVVAIDEEAPSLGVATWSDGPFAYAAVSDRGRVWLEHDLAALRDSVTAQLRAGDDSAPQR